MKSERTAGDRLSGRALALATLERQSLLARCAVSLEALLEHLVGLQAQAVAPPYVGLWARLKDFSPQDLDRSSAERRVVRCTLMRGTLHLVTARDALALRATVQPVVERMFWSAHGRAVEGIDLADLRREVREALADGPLTYQALGAALQARWPERKLDALLGAARTVEPLAQAPPPAWGGGTRVRMAPLTQWLGAPLPRPIAVSVLIRRYLAAFGPASIADMRAWCGMRGLSEAVDALRPQLRTFRDESGAELFDLPDAPRPGADVDPPVRLLGGFDGTILGLADRSRFLAPEHASRIATPNGLFHPLILVEARVAGTWRLRMTGRRASVELTPFSPLPASARAQLTAEAEALLGVAGSRHEHLEVVFVKG